MTDYIHHLKEFAKGDTKKIDASSKIHCVIYTRVSTKEQTDGLSLTTQKKGCEAYALKENMEVVSYFGGTYESAQTDERQHFKKMLDFVKKSRVKIEYILVYSVDRFSRSGANAIYISNQLKKAGVRVLSVTQPSDTNTATGTFQQNIQFIFSQYDNDQRREKCMAGTREKLLQGEWCTMPPKGYSSVKINGVRKLVLNEDGKLIKKAFMWKAIDGLSSEEIRKRLAAMGLKLNSQYLSKLLRNPFYCGYLSHRSLNGELVEGKHEKLISMEIFLKANNSLKKNAQGYKWNNNGESIPLKRFIKCANCGKPLRGYLARKKGLYYYKCGDKCNCNKSAKQLHGIFSETLSHLTIDAKYVPMLKEELMKVFEERNNETVENQVLIEKQLKEINAKIERLEERFILEEIDKELYVKFRSKFIAEKEEIQKNIQKDGLKKSNLDVFIEKALHIASNLSDLWDSSTFEGRQKLQFLLFPEGIYYDKKNDQCRTDRVNSIFYTIATITSSYEGNKKGEDKPKFILPPSVVRRGIEPLLPE